MSIFIATLGFKGPGDYMDLYLAEAKLGILIGSIISAVVGLMILYKRYAKSDNIDAAKEAEELNPQRD